MHGDCGNTFMYLSRQYLLKLCIACHKGTETFKATHTCGFVERCLTSAVLQLNTHTIFILIEN